MRRKNSGISRCLIACNHHLPYFWHGDWHCSPLHPISQSSTGVAHGRQDYAPVALGLGMSVGNGGFKKYAKKIVVVPRNRGEMITALLAGRIIASERESAILSQDLFMHHFDNRARGTDHTYPPSLVAIPGSTQNATMSSLLLETVLREVCNLK